MKRFLLLITCIFCISGVFVENIDTKTAQNESLNFYDVQINDVVEKESNNNQFLTEAYNYPLNSHRKVYPNTLSPYPTEFVQPDGTKVMIIGKGNADLSYTETLDGYTLLKSKDGFFEYAILNNKGDMVPSGVKARNVEERTNKEKKILLGITKGLKYSPTQKSKIKQIRGAVSELKMRFQIEHSFPHKGERKIPVLLIDYPDLESKYSVSDLSDLLNQPNYNGTGSFRDYFMQASNNKLILDADVHGWYRAKNSYKHYSHESGGFEISRELVIEAIDQAEQAGVDFSQYDNNLDGYVDAVLVIHAGPGAEEGSMTEYIWSNAWSIYGETHRKYDGVEFKKYAINPETRWNGIVGIGVFCHEFAHTLGLPDLYDLDGDSAGTGRWCLMSGGGWSNQEKSPTSLSAWAKTDVGWVVPKIIESGSNSISYSEDNNEVLKILTQNTDEYFLLENRQKKGIDKFLPGHGLAIWHINIRQSFPMNNYVENKYVDLEEADGLAQMDTYINSGDGGDLYPGSSNATVFGDTSNPNSKLYSGESTSINISSIKEDDSVVSFEASFPPINADSLILVSIHIDYGYMWDTDTNWLTGNLADWHGVTVENGEVVGLDLSYNYLNHEIPPQIAELTNLKSLCLDGNDMVGPILIGIENLTNLEHLSLRSNNLKDRIPKEIEELVNLKTLDLGDNSFSGVIPDGIGNLVNLTTLKLDNNNLTGEIPQEIGNLTKLTHLDFSNNNLTGQIPQEIINFTNLETLSFGNNELEGRIPDLSNLEDLHYFDIANNSFTFTDIAFSQITYSDVAIFNYNSQALIAAPIPTKTGDNYILTMPEENPKNKYMWFKDSQIIVNETERQLTIPINSSLYHCQVTNSTYPNLTLTTEKFYGNPINQQDSLALVALYDSCGGNNWTNNTNWFTEKIINWYGVELELESGRVVKLLLSDNNLSGKIPEEISNITNLTEIYLNNNNLRGEIPQEIGNLVNLRHLNLSLNDLTGEIPQGIGNLTKLVDLFLNDNNFTGEIPNLSPMTNLEYLDIKNNSFTFANIVASQIFSGDISNFDYTPQANISAPIMTLTNDGFTLTITNGHPQNQYRWFKDWTEIVGETTQQLTMTKDNNGLYNSRITNALYPELVLSADQLSVTITGTDDVRERGIYIYPIPAKDNLQITSNEFLGDMQLEIFNLSGKCVYSKKILSPFVKKIDISSLKSEIHILKMKLGNEIITSKISIIR